MPKPAVRRTSGRRLLDSERVEGRGEGTPLKGQSEIGSTPTIPVPNTSKEDNNYPECLKAPRVKRPPNSFILFRREVVKVYDNEYAAKLWSEMSEESKRPWREKAKVEWEEHFSKHPDYMFRARRKPKRRLRSEEGKKEGPLRKVEPSKNNVKNHSGPLYEDQNSNQHSEFVQRPMHAHLLSLPMPSTVPAISDQSQVQQYYEPNPLPISVPDYELYELYFNLGLCPQDVGGFSIQMPYENILDPLTYSQMVPEQFLSDFGAFDTQTSMQWPLWPEETCYDLPTYPFL